MHSPETGGNSPLLRITVNGIPRPKGSYDVRPNLTVKEPATTRNWQSVIATAANIALLGRAPRFTGPVRVTLNFRKSGKAITAPDIDKLCRAVLDSISGGTRFGFPIYVDDSQVVELIATKEGNGSGGFTPKTYTPGVDILVERAEVQAGDLDGPDIDENREDWLDPEAFAEIISKLRGQLGVIETRAEFGKAITSAVACLARLRAKAE